MMELAKSERERGEKVLRNSLQLVDTKTKKAKPRSKRFELCLVWFGLYTNHQKRETKTKNYRANLTNGRRDINPKIRLIVFTSIGFSCVIIIIPT